MRCLMALACTLTITIAAAADELRWEPLPNIPYGVICAAASVVDQVIVVSGGFGQDGMPTRFLQVFDLQTSQWRDPVRMEVGRSQHAQVTLGHEVMVIGGSTAWGNRSPQGTADCQRLDVATMTLRPAAPLPQAIATPTAHVLPDGRVLALGGTLAFVYDPAADRWSEPITLHAKRVSHTSVLLGDGRVLAIGGGRRSMEVIDATSGESRKLEVELPFPLDDLRATRLPDGRVWVLAGQRTDTGDTVDQTWLVSLSGPEATLADGPSLQMEGGVADHVIVEIGPWVVLVGGESQQFGKDIERVQGRLLDRRTLAVWSLPSTAVPHDDATGVAVGASAIVLSGYRVSAAAPGVRPFPIAVREVHKLQLPLQPSPAKTDNN